MRGLQDARPQAVTTLIITSCFRTTLRVLLSFVGIGKRAEYTSGRLTIHHNRSCA
jgi:hypothetical protein